MISLLPMFSISLMPGSSKWAPLACTGKAYWRERLSTVDLQIKISCFVERKNIVTIWKLADLNWLVQGPLNWAFPFSKGSLTQVFPITKSYFYFWNDENWTHTQSHTIGVSSNFFLKNFTLFTFQCWPLKALSRTV